MFFKKALIIFGSVALNFAACAEGDFKERKSRSTAGSGDLRPHQSSAVSSNTLTFVVDESTSHIIDVVMVVDNSSSMLRIRDAVQREFRPLFRRFSEQADVQLTIITATSESAPFCMPTSEDFGAYFTVPSVSDFVHINCAIDSFSDMQTLIKLIDEGQLAGVSSREVFRDGALKMFVMISDDGPPPRHAEQFLRLAESLWGKEMIRFYHFTATDPRIAKPQIPGIEYRDDVIYLQHWLLDMGFEPFWGWGERVKGWEPHWNSCGNIYTEGYQKLSDYFIGKAFPICTENWPNSFAEMMDHVRSSVQRSYVLYGWQSSPDLSLQVTVSGEELRHSEFTLRQQNFSYMLHIADDVALSPGDKIVVLRE